MKTVTKEEFFKFIRIFEETHPKMEVENFEENITLYLGGSGYTIKGVALHLPATKEYIYILDSEFE